MKGIITDSDALQAVSVLSVHSYLRAEGWHRGDDLGDRGVVYLGPSDVEVFAPGSDRLGDYPSAISSVVEAIARSENRDELSVYRDLVTADRDVIRFRAPDADDDGSIGLLAGVDLVEQSKEALLAAACSAGSPQRFFRSGRNIPANEYLQSVKLGQTEHGSFVVNLFSPVPPQLSEIPQQSFWPELDEEPFSRKVTRTLANSIEALIDALGQVGRGASIEAFEAAVNYGVSSNLCSAISKLAKDGDGLDFSLSWARTRPAPVPRFTRRFSESDSEILTEAAKVLKQRQSFNNEILEGYITGLNRDVTPVDGKVSLKTFVDGQPRSVMVSLPPAEYRQALDAHDARNVVEIEGDLEFEGQRYYLRRPRNLRVKTEREEQ
ncbi:MULTISPECIES: hypothetical protein [unclassified Yoonia]|uniref:hypothetical protein n=1 Tax=unclassified Yoonia TaxID=2629118 RepID=UPI002AFF6206|nr:MULTISPECIES: hypothetical protein [unclassified Yoonia]